MWNLLCVILSESVLLWISFLNHVTSISTDPNKLMVIGGSTGGPVDRVQVVNLNNASEVCVQPSPPPDLIIGREGGVIDGKPFVFDGRFGWERPIKMVKVRDFCIGYSLQVHV